MLNWCFPPTSSVSSVAELIDRVYEGFIGEELHYGHGTDNAWDEAVALVLDSLGIADDQENLQIMISDADSSLILERLRQRVEQRVPVPYLTGRCRFGGLELFVEPGVIIPRSPIGEIIAGDAKPWVSEPVLQVLDLCCGSGCLGIAAAVQFLQAQVICADIDQQAISLAQRNVEHHQLGDRVSVIASNLFAGLESQRFDVIFCNPPYVNAADMRTMPAEYQHEPRLALESGTDGLDLVRLIVKQVGKWLQPHGILVLEVGNSEQDWDIDVPVTWVELAGGGQGVMVLEAKNLNQ